MYSRFFVMVILLIALGGAPPALAGELPGGEEWALSTGFFNLRGDIRPEFGVELRFARVELFKLPDFRPFAGVSGTPDRNVWVYVGLGYHYELNERWILVPSVAVSLYEQARGFDLGGVVEFRSGLEIDYRLKDGSRIGVFFHHLSNSRVYELNPGSETLGVVWSIGI